MHFYGLQFKSNKNTLVPKYLTVLYKYMSTPHKLLTLTAAQLSTVDYYVFRLEWCSK